MKLSWNWLSEWVDLSGVGGPEGLDRLLTARGLEVEDREELSKGLEKVVTAKILERAPHPGADRLSVCKVTTGSGEPLQIVCGAQNMKAGDVVALAQVGALLPNGLKIGASKIRNVESFGMLCSEQELKLKDASEGILILPSATKLGVPLAEALGRDDTIFEIKLTANRADCLSVRGIAREVAAASGQKLRTPPGYKEEALEFGDAENANVKLFLEAGEEGPQFYGCLIEGVKVGASPEAWKKKLEAIGSRSINNLVDATNLVLFELGHPVHAYDADRIEGSTLRIRRAKTGEKLPLLDGTEVEATTEDLVIGDGARAVGLAGVMGGGNSEISDSTTRVYLECAEFDPVRVRRTSKRFAKKSEASHRFERGIDPSELPRVIKRLAALILEASGLEAGGAKVIEASRAVHPSRAEGSRALARREIRVSPAFFNTFLGLATDPSLAQEELKKLGCEIKEQSGSWIVKPPLYRLDLAIPEDLAEEVARTIGYDQIPATLPALTTPPLREAAGPGAEELARLNAAKDALVSMGLTETLNYSFLSRAWLQHFGMDSQGVKVMNPLSEEQEVLTPSLIPGLVKNAVDALSRHFGSESLPLRLFEIRPTFHRIPGKEVASTGKDPSKPDETGVKEIWKLSFLLSGPRMATGLARENTDLEFADAKGILEALLQRLGTKGVRTRALESATQEKNPDAFPHLFHPGQAMELWLGKDLAGVFGRLHPKLEKEWKIRRPIWIAELDWAKLRTLSMPADHAFPLAKLPEFPSVSRDFSVLVPEEIDAERIIQLCLKVGRPLAKSAKIFDIYRGSQVKQGSQSVSIRVLFSEPARSLVETEVEQAAQAIVKAMAAELGAELR